MGLRTALLTGLTTLVLTACGGGGDGAAPAPNPNIAPLVDTQLRQLFTALSLTGDPAQGRNLPSINDPLAQLGKKLFFSKSLSGDMDTACASCHHPLLGGSSGLALPIGTGAQTPDLLGLGRKQTDDNYVARNAPSTFNIGVYDVGLFHDSRIESIGRVAGANGSGSGIRTPDTPLGVLDPNAGETLPAAQARFPVTVVMEMRGDTFEAGADNDAVRNHLAARLGNYGVGAGELGPINNWLNEFQTAFASALPADLLLTYENIALALGEYVRSQVFVDTPWRAYVQGDDDAISAAAKRGALLFLRNPPTGAGCLRCHVGDFFTDEEHHAIGFPQVGPGKGDGNEDDFGRARESAQLFDRYRYRTPTLLNVEVTGPYTHSGAYTSLQRTVDHYRDPEGVVTQFFAEGGLCAEPQFIDDPDCATNFPDSSANTMAAIGRMLSDRMDDPNGSVVPDLTGTFTPDEVADVTAFLETLTDPCVKNRACLAPWIPDSSEDPDGNQLNAVDESGDPL